MKPEISAILLPLNLAQHIYILLIRQIRQLAPLFVEIHSKLMALGWVSPRYLMAEEIMQKQIQAVEAKEEQQKEVVV